MQFSHCNYDLDISHQGASVNNVAKPLQRPTFLDKSITFCKLLKMKTNFAICKINHFLNDFLLIKLIQFTNGYQFVKAHSSYNEILMKKKVLRSYTWWWWRRVGKWLIRKHANFIWQVWNWLFNTFYRLILSWWIMKNRWCCSNRWAVLSMSSHTALPLVQMYYPLLWASGSTKHTKTSHYNLLQHCLSAPVCNKGLSKHVCVWQRVSVNKAAYCCWAKRNVVCGVGGNRLLIIFHLLYMLWNGSASLACTLVPLALLIPGERNPGLLGMNWVVSHCLQCWRDMVLSLYTNLKTTLLQMQV